jgi:hypothetical protein
MPSAEVIQAGIARAQEIKAAIQNSGGKKKFFDVLGPNGQAWKTAYPGFSGMRAIYFCPSWKEGGPVFVERVKRYWRSHNYPQGRSIYAGDDSLVAKAVSLAYQQGYNKDNLYLKRNRQFAWQGFALEVDPNTQALFPNPMAHVDEQGKLRPMIFQTSMTSHNKVLQEMNVVGAAQVQKQGGGDPSALGFMYCIHPEHGRPFLIQKTKTGPASKDVSYGISRLEQMPLPQEYHAGLHNLWPLEDLFKEASPQEQVAAILDAGLPMPPEAQQFMTHGGSMVQVPGNLQAPPPPPPQQWGQQPQQGGFQMGAGGPGIPPVQPFQQAQQQWGAPVQQQPMHPQGNWANGPAAMGQPFQQAQHIPQGMPQPPMSFNQGAMPPTQNPFHMPPPQQAQQPMPLPQPQHSSGMAASAPPPPPMPQNVPQGAGGPPPPPPGAGAPPPPPAPQQPPPAPQQPVQQPAASSPPAQQPAAMTPEQLQAQFMGGTPQF